MEEGWQGFDADLCKAVAAAVLGDATKVRWVPLNAQQRFTALASGETVFCATGVTKGTLLDGVVQRWGMGNAHVEAMRLRGIEVRMPLETIVTPVDALHLCEVAQEGLAGGFGCRREACKHEPVAWKS